MTFQPHSTSAATTLQGYVHWTEPFTSRLVGDVKLVGPTISCEGSPLNGDFRGKWRHNPHVQSYVVATDQVRAVQASQHLGWRCRWLPRCCKEGQGAACCVA